MADTHGSGPCARKGVEVQVLSPAPLKKEYGPPNSMSAARFAFSRTVLNHPDGFAACFCVFLLINPLLCPSQTQDPPDSAGKRKAYARAKAEQAEKQPRCHAP